MSRVTGPVLVVGTGLLGTSIGLALQAHGVEVWLRDVSDEHVRTARGLGAGTPAPADGGEPQLVVIAVPPALLGQEIAAALAEFPRSVVTDVGSVKREPLESVRARGADSTRYVGSHPSAPTRTRTRRQSRWSPSCGLTVRGHGWPRRSAPRRTSVSCWSGL